MNEMMSNSRRYFAGHAAMMGATIMWGMMSPIAKGVLESGYIDGLALSAIRIGGGALLFILASLLPRSLTGDCKVRGRDLFTLFLASLVMISANQGLFIIGIQYTTPVDTSVMCTLTPVFTLLLAAMFIGQKLTPLKILGVVLGLTGALIIAFAGGKSGIAKNPLLGNMLCIVAQVCAAIYYVFFLNVINKYSPFAIMKWMFLFSALTYVPAMTPFLMQVEWNALDTSIYLSLGYIILFPTFLAYLIIPFSQRILKPTVIAMYAYFQPVVAALLAWVMGLAAFGWSRVAGSILIFLGVFLVSFAVKKVRDPKESSVPK